MKKMSVILKAEICVHVPVSDEDITSLGVMIAENNTLNIYSDAFEERHGALLQRIRNEITAQGDKAVVRAHVAEIYNAPKESVSE